MQSKQLDNSCSYRSQLVDVPRACADYEPEVSGMMVDDTVRMTHHPKSRDASMADFKVAARRPLLCVRCAFLSPKGSRCECGEILLADIAAAQGLAYGASAGGVPYSSSGRLSMQPPAGQLQPGLYAARLAAFTRGLCGKARQLALASLARAQGSAGADRIVPAESQNSVVPVVRWQCESAETCHTS